MYDKICLGEKVSSDEKERGRERERERMWRERFPESKDKRKLENLVISWIKNSFTSNFRMKMFLSKTKMKCSHNSRVLCNPTYSIYVDKDTYISFLRQSLKRFTFYVKSSDSIFVLWGLSPIVN